MQQLRTRLIVLVLNETKSWERLKVREDCSKFTNLKIKTPKRTWK